MSTYEETIAAISTARGRSALAVVRLSGPRVLDVAARVLDPWPIEERRATLCAIRHPLDGTLVERGIATLFRAPRSFTGEDTLEITTHGGVAVPLAVLRALLSAGAREAMPGEFTRRAVLSGRLDLVQAEAIGDLIDARTDSMRRVAIRQADGALSHRVHELRARILEVEALIAYDIDFPEEDDGPLASERVHAAVSALREAIARLLATAPAAAIAREGAVVVLGGRPNAGKSSLFNGLLGEARAIVTDVPGTTRDAIEELVEHAGWPLRLVDTAGLRAVDDPVEQLGVDLSRRYIGGADLVLACDDDGGRLPALVGELRELTRGRVIPVLTKCDVGEHPSAVTSLDGVVPTSARSGEGLRPLLDRVVRELETMHGSDALDVPLLTRERHTEALRRAQHEVEQFERHWLEANLPTAIAAVHLRTAVDALDELTGGIDADEILGRLFSTFCVGK